MSVETGALASKKKSLFGNIGKAVGSVFYDEVPGEQDTSTEVQAPSSISPFVAPVASTITLGGIDQSTRQRLTEALNENKLDSYDYLKFKTALQELTNDIPDERQRFKAVFATAKALNITKDKLVQTANHYVMVLDEEAKKFNEAVSDSVQQTVVANETKVKSIDASITAKNTQIKQLTDEIASLTTERTTLTGTIARDKGAIETSKANFVATHSAMVQDIKNDITKMTTYLG